MTAIDRTDPAKRPSGLFSSPAIASAAVAIAAAVIAALVVSHTHQGRYGATVLLGLLVPLVSLRLSRSLIALGAVVLAWCLVVAYMSFIPDLINPQPVVSDAVGQAAWYGTPYVGPQIAAACAAATLLAIAAAAVFARGRGAWRERISANGKGGEPRPPALPVLGVLGVAVGVSAFTLIPDPKTYFEPHLVTAYWDTANFLAWQGLLAHGLVPMKDFFYPYGGQWVYDVVPEGPLLRWLAEVSMLALSAWSLWKPSGFRPWRVAICVLAVPLAADLNQDILWRYLPALLMATTYAALGPARHRRPVAGHLVFGAACLLAVFLEPDLVVYGLAGIALVLTGELLSGTLPRQPKALLRGLAIDALPLLGAVVLVVGSWVLMGSVDGNLRLYLGLRAVSAAAAIDPNTTALFHLSLKPSSYVIYLTAPALLLIAGLARALLGSRGDQGVAPILLGASGVTFVFLIKHLSRFVGDTMLVIPLLALTWIVILIWDTRRFAASAAIGAFVGAMWVSVRHAPGTAPSYLSQAIRSPAHAVDALLLPTRIGEIRRASDSRFRASSLRGWPERAGVHIYRSVVGEKRKTRFWVLGDGQVLYPMLDQAPPYQTEPYDASPIAEQREVLRRLEQARPPLMIWSRDLLPFSDPVPYQVRTPLLYAYAVRHYVPVRHGASYDVLRLRRPGEPAAAGYWHRYLGSLRLLYIPSYSQALDSPKCRSGPDCASYAVAESNSPVNGQTVVLGFKAGKRTFWATFRARTGVNSYPVRLDRLWFSSIVGAHPKVRSGTPGWSVRLTSRRTGDALY